MYEILGKEEYYMPRGVKGSGKKPVNAKKPATEKKSASPTPPIRNELRRQTRKLSSCKSSTPPAKN